MGYGFFFFCLSFHLILSWYMAEWGVHSMMVTLCITYDVYICVQRTSHINMYIIEFRASLDDGICFGCFGIADCLARRPITCSSGNGTRVSEPTIVAG